MRGNRIHVNTKTWAFEPEGAFHFPEWEDERVRSTRKNGLAFSGGGNRSAPLTAGYLRVLKDLGVIDKVGYISSVSGGSWAAVPFTYLDPTISDNQFLGAFIPPSDLRWSDLATPSQKRFTDAVADSVVIDDLLGTLFSGDERFAKIINSIYLEPFLLGDRHKFFSYDTDTVREILNRNPELSVFDFYKVRTGRPYLIANGILSRSNPLQVNRYPFEMTPLYSGIPTHFPGEGSLGRFDIGGGYVESFAFDSDSPDDQKDRTGRVHVRIKKKQNIFSLSDVIATSGAAPAEHLDRFGVELGFPEFNYWSPVEIDKAKEYDFADGGLLDNSGILSLLRRGVNRIIAFVNGSARLEHAKDVSDMIEPLFQECPNYLGMSRFDKNIVLSQPSKNSQELYDDLIREMFHLKNDGKPVVVEREYITLHNPHHGIAAGQSVSICWVYNAFVSEWYESLRDSRVKTYVEQQQRKKHFPNYSTVLANPPKLIDMDLEQANALAQLAGYVIHSSAAKDFF